MAWHVTTRHMIYDRIYYDIWYDMKWYGELKQTKNQKDTELQTWITFIDYLRLCISSDTAYIHGIKWFVHGTNYH